MAQTKLMIAAFFLAVIFSLIIQSTEGRNLKPKNKNEFQVQRKIPGQDSGKFIKHGEGLPTDCSGMAACVKEAALTTPVAPLSATAVSQPPPPGHADDFRPTTPGHSPGIGHAE